MFFRGRLPSALLAAVAAFALQASSGAPVVAVPSAHAHSFVEMSVDFLAQRAHRVVLATPVDEMSTWETTQSGRRIVTYHRLQVRSDIVGQGDEEIMVRRLGGAVGKIGQRVHGAAPLRRGQPFLLFLAKRPDGSFSVVGMEQGCFPLVIKNNQPVRIEQRRFSHGPVPVKPGARPASMLEGRSLEDARRIIMEARAKHAK